MYPSFNQLSGGQLEREKGSAGKEKGQLEESLHNVMPLLLGPHFHLISTQTVYLCQECFLFHAG